MQKIIPNIWFDREAEDAAKFYSSVFKNSKILSTTKYPEAGNEIHGQTPGSTMTVSFELEGLRMLALNGGPVFKINPSISLFVQFENEEEITNAWNKLVEGGEVLMEFRDYPWALKYGWLNDKYGLSWQLSWGLPVKEGQKITPLFMFTQDVTGKAREAIETYTKIFDNSKIDLLLPYDPDDDDSEDNLKHARFTLCGNSFMAMDSSGPHKFTFNEAFSLIVECEDQNEIDKYWEALSAVPEAEQCGWLKDKHGVSWQIVPKGMEEILNSEDKEKRESAMKAMLEMKKIEIDKLK